MRLAYIVGSYPKASETFIAREVDGLRARGHEVCLFSLFVPESGPLADVHYGWQSELDLFLRRYTPRKTIRTLAGQWQQQMAALRCDTLVAHFGSLPSTVALEAAGDLPLFISLHARDIYVEADRLEEKCARARAVVTCTQANVDHLRAQFPRHAEKIHLIYHGLPAEWLNMPLPDRSRPPGEPLRLLAAGRLVEKKGFNYLLDACARLHRQGFPINITLIGDGPLHDKFTRRRTRARLQDIFALEGWVGQDELRAGLAWADVFCCPSVIAPDGDRDGLPNVLVEAMASGLPVIGSRLSGIPEAVEDGVTGLLVPPADANALAIAITCCADPDLRTRMGQQARTRIHQRFNAAPWLDKFESILQGHKMEDDTQPKS